MRDENGRKARKERNKKITVDKNRPWKEREEYLVAGMVEGHWCRIQAHKSGSRCLCSSGESTLLYQPSSRLHMPTLAEMSLEYGDSPAHLPWKASSNLDSGSETSRFLYVHAFSFTSQNKTSGIFFPFSEPNSSSNIFILTWEFLQTLQFFASRGA